MTRRSAKRSLILSAAGAWVAAAIVAVTNAGVLAEQPNAPAPRLAWPIAGADVTQLFGPSASAIEPAFGKYPHFHTGIDFAAPPGSPVIAAASGKVLAVGNQRVGGVETGYGYYVAIAHGRQWATVYAHLIARPTVAIGQQVAQGQVVGFEGSTGNSTGPHVHFELRHDDVPVDPAPFLSPAL